MFPLQFFFAYVPTPLLYRCFAAEFMHREMTHFSLAEQYARQLSLISLLQNWLLNNLRKKTETKRIVKNVFVNRAVNRG